MSIDAGLREAHEYSGMYVPRHSSKLRGRVRLSGATKYIELQSPT